MKMEKRQLTLNEARSLSYQIEEFLLSCGGKYQSINREISVNVMTALAVNHYYLKKKAGVITDFCCYYTIRKNDVDSILLGTSNPDNFYCHNRVLYVVELGTSRGLKGILNAIKWIKGEAKQYDGEILWHNPRKQKGYLYNVNSKRGIIYGIK